ncbi:hypothetical protein [Achromobacter xylosoxidans]
MRFHPYPAVPIAKQKNGLIHADAKALRMFWDEIDALYGEDASFGVGCYVFSVRAGSGEKPWYVGMAEKQSFRKECFTSHKINHYNNAIAARRGTPLLTIIPKYTPGGWLSAPNGKGHRDVQKLEAMLISNCLRRNRGLLNLKDTKILREMMVPGLLNSPPGTPAREVAAFKALLGV